VPLQYAAGDDSDDPDGHGDDSSDDVAQGQHLGSATATYSLQLLPGEKVLQVRWGKGRSATSWGGPAAVAGAEWQRLRLQQSLPAGSSSHLHCDAATLHRCSGTHPPRAALPPPTPQVSWQALQPELREPRSCAAAVLTSHRIMIVSGDLKIITQAPAEGGALAAVHGITSMCWAGPALLYTTALGALPRLPPWMALPAGSCCVRVRPARGGARSAGRA
jgi:hypothetical protein